MREDGMSPFWLFAGHEYESAEGGFQDFMGAFETLEDAVSEARRMLALEPKWKHFVPEWWHVVDIRECKMVARGGPIGDRPLID